MVMNMNLSTNGLFYAEEASVVVGSGVTEVVINNIRQVVGEVCRSETFSIYPLKILPCESIQNDDLLHVDKDKTGVLIR